MSGARLLQGNEACVEGAIAAGLRFFAGYPITPSTEIAELCALRLPQVGGKFIQMEDEIASMGAVCGASLTGVFPEAGEPGFRDRDRDPLCGCQCPEGWPVDRNADVTCPGRRHASQMG